MENLNLQKPEEWTPNSEFLSVMFGGKEKQLTELKDEEKRKLTLFEKQLGKSLATTDTIDAAINKIVRTALAAEFGPSILTIPEAKGMVNTIASGILQDSTLRKQALVIIDKFAREPID